MLFKNIFTIFLLAISFNVFSVSNQELMDRLDDIELDIELARQQREFDRLMDDYTRMMTQPRPYVQPNTQGSSKSNRLLNICYVYWDGSRFKLGETSANSGYTVIKNGNDLSIALPKSLVSSLKVNLGVGEKVNSKTFLDFMGRHWGQIENLCQREFK
jgi:hypothetical protein